MKKRESVAIPTAVSAGTGAGTIAILVNLIGFAGTFLGILVQGGNSLRVGSFFADDRTNNLPMTHIAEIIGQIFIIADRLHFVTDSRFHSTAKTSGTFDTDITDAITLTGQITINFL